MNKLISIVGASGTGKTALVNALSKTGKFATAYEQHIERPFQALFKQDKSYALHNQVDYFLLRAEQEQELRIASAQKIGLMDGGLDLDFHGFSLLFHQRGLLTDAEHALCTRLYAFIRTSLPFPDLIVHLCADERTVAERLSQRHRINIASVEDTALFNSNLEKWLSILSPSSILKLDASGESILYEKSVEAILERISSSTF
jgi:deoxyadenosine/deoxycytidine kinase